MTLHPFFLTNQSPWPILTSFSSMIFFTGFTSYFHQLNLSFFLFSFLPLLSSSFLWWRDILRESTFLGEHTIFMIKMFKLSMILFITSEMFFFMSFFWNFFHNSLSPDISIGSNWPPMNILMLNPYSIPLLNTIILLSSGFSLTWAHHNIIIKNNKSMIQLFLTIILGVYFSLLQKFEYNEATFSLSDSIFGSSFFLTTGFHGLHVLIGTLFLLLNLLRLFLKQLNNKHHFSFEASAWYWHFVDVIWIFLYTFFYWWIF